MNLAFLGAAGEVTGSCHLVDTGRVRFLMDCGMFQGRDAREKNFARFRFDPREIAFVLVSHAHIDHSMRINSIRSGAVILSASGMCEGGRVRHHLHYNLSRPECAVVFAGFQAAGTLGRSIVDGAATVRLLGEPHPVRARVFTIGGLSAHADRAALLGWLKGFRQPPRQTWVVHGESLPAHALRDELRRWGWTADVPSAHQAVDLA